MQHARPLAPVSLLGILLSLSVSAQGSSQGVVPGAWGVGFTILQTVDSTRMMPGGGPRPLDIGVWYPTRTTASARLTYRDYFLAGADADELEKFIRFAGSKGALRSELDAWLDAPMLGSRNAESSDARFPLVLIAQGNGQSIHDQAPLAEYLASHGYVVATTPSPMRVTGPLTNESQIGERAAEQALDLARARDILRRGRTDVAAERIGIVGHSFGARGALLLAMQDTTVCALVSLDGGIGTATGRASMEAMPGYRPQALRTSLLHFYEEEDEYMSPDFSLLRSLPGSERWIQRTPLRHHLFSALGAASVDHPRLRPAVAATDSAAAAYVAVTAETADFLDAFVKRDAGSRFRRERTNHRSPLAPYERL